MSAHHSDPTSTTGSDAPDTAGGTTPRTPDAAGLPALRARNTFAVFCEGDAAVDAVVALERTGIDGSRISALALGDADEVLTGREAVREEDAAALGSIGGSAGTGVAVGSIAGALGGAALAVALPGVGVGILAVAAGAAVAGAGVGGFAGAVSGTPATPAWEQALVALREGHVVVGLHSAADEDHTAGHDLLAERADRVHLVDADGQPVD